MAATMTPVTDPNILAQLNSAPAPSGLKPVTDPAVLAQLNGTPDSHKSGSFEEMRPSESIGGFIGSELGSALSKSYPKDEQDKRAKQVEDTGKSFGLGVESMVNSLAQFIDFNDKKSRDQLIDQAKDVQSHADKLPQSERITGEVLSSAVPFGAAGKAATGAKSVGEMGKAEKVIQALKTVGAGGTTTAALTPVTDKKKDFATEKATQFGEGAAGTALLGGGIGAVNKVLNIGKDVLNPTERAATIKKLTESLGFKTEDIGNLSERAKATTDIAATGAANAVKQPTINTQLKTNEQLGSTVQTALTGRQKELEAMRELQTGPIASQARKSQTPIATQGVLNMLRDESKLSKETAEGKAIYETVMKELTGYNTLPQGSVSVHAIPSSKYEAVRAQIKELVEKGYNGKPLDERRAKVLNDAATMLDQSARKAVPKWGEFLDKYKQLSKPLDDFKRQEGGQIGKLTKTDNVTGNYEVPGEKVVDHLIDGGATRVRAAMQASGGAPEVKKAVEHRLWQQVSEMAKNNKMTPAAMDTFIQKHVDVLKELGLHDKFDVARNQLKAAEAINKTAIGKMAKSSGNNSDSFSTLGSILRAGEGQRLAGLTELKNLTAGDRDAREALRTGIVMQMVTESPTTAQLSRQAILPDLEKSGLFNRADIDNVKQVTAKFDQLMKIGPNAQPKTVVESIMSGALHMIPGGKKVGAFMSGAKDAVMTPQLQQARNILEMAAIDPAAAKILLSTPTEKTMREGLNAMQRAGIYMTVNEAMK